MLTEKKASMKINANAHLMQLKAKKLRILTSSFIKFLGLVVSLMTNLNRLKKFIIHAMPSPSRHHSKT